MHPEITARELQEELAGPNPPRILDVRETNELEISKLENALHIPMSKFGERFREVDQNQNWVIVCRSGNRSGQVTHFLAAKGYKVRNLVGGLNGWAKDVDPTMATY